ncbi:unnamed protein product, partial [Meganyctiphanes norvegica]
MTLIFLSNCSEMSCAPCVKYHPMKSKNCKLKLPPPLLLNANSSYGLFRGLRTFANWGPPGDVVYAGFGRKKDFDYLESVGISVTGRIVLVRYGKAFRANAAAMAEAQGAIGVIFYSDPVNYAPSTPDDVYPRSVLMPPSAAPAGTVKLKDGDPLTPFYPAIESAFHIPEEEAPIPKIPTQPISYRDAWAILSRMGGPEAPSEWQGGLNITYHLGPQLQQEGWKVNLEVHTSSKNTTTYNVLGVIRGAQEPDRYVILGNHIDAWILGSIDPSCGTAAMMELSRVMLKLKEETGWRPRRSIIFAAWGSEEYGLVGSQEWTEQFGKQLADRTLAYLNVDMAIEGNYTLRTKSAPLLYDIVFEATKKIPNPDPAEVEAGRLTVYDTWALKRPDPKNPKVPWMQLVGSGSDYKGFQHNLGIPCLDLRYTHSNYTLGEPMYHTLYETFELVDELYDRGFHFHKATTALWGYLAVNIADSLVIPFSLEKYEIFIHTAYHGILEKYGDVIAAQNITMKYFHNACQNFKQRVISFREKQANLDTHSPLAVRHMNDQLMMVERAFIDPRGLPGRTDYNHILTAPSATDAYAGTAFAGLTDTLVAITESGDEELSQLWRTFRHHLSVVTHYLDTAAKVLTDDLW